MIAAHGSRIRYYHEVLGVNSRLDTLQAVILKVKLGRISRNVQHGAAQRGGALQRAAERDSPRRDRQVEAADVPGTSLTSTPARARAGDSLAAFLKEKGIPHGIYYPVPLHLQKAFGLSGEGRRGNFPVTGKRRPPKRWSRSPCTPSYRRAGSWRSRTRSRRFSRRRPDKGAAHRKILSSFRPRTTKRRTSPGWYRYVLDQAEVWTC